MSLPGQHLLKESGNLTWRTVVGHGEPFSYLEFKSSVAGLQKDCRLDWTGLQKTGLQLRSWPSGNSDQSSCPGFHQV